MPGRERKNIMIVLLSGTITLQVFGHRVNSCPSGAETCFCKCSEIVARHENGTERESVLQADIKKARH
jgi:hypothetical protein